jgi:hypothetical protein
MNISGKLNFLSLKAAVRKMKSANGEIDCLIIPIEQNHLFRGEKGIYLDLIAFETKPRPVSKDTHIIKQSLPKDIRENMSKEDLNAMPILGSLQTWNSAPVDQISDVEPMEEKEDLPF